MTSDTRIYLVTNTADKTRRLVRAPSRVTAQKHVSTNVFEAHLATQSELAELLMRGASIETASVPINPNESA